jgi:HSP20 family protein
MTSIIRWDPMREMTGVREMMDRLFDESFARPFSTALADGYGAGLPALDVYQTDNEIVVKAGLPGVKADDVQISVANGVLSIRGEVKEEMVERKGTYHLRERRYGSFARSISLPTDVDADKAHAEFDDGVLTLTLPKSEQVKPKTITVKARK